MSWSTICRSCSSSDPAALLSGRALGDPGDRAADKFAIGAGINLDFFENTSTAIIEGGAQVNQDPNYQTAEQSVDVDAHALAAQGVSLDAWWFPGALNDEAKKIDQSSVFVSIVFRQFSLLELEGLLRRHAAPKLVGGGVLLDVYTCFLGIAVKRGVKNRSKTRRGHEIKEVIQLKLMR